jgi:DNA polymerase I-like protein with 3'-5' exonuclease and polymerase domains
VDFETSRFPDGSPHRKTAKAVSWAASSETEDVFSYYTDADFRTQLQKVLDDTTLLVGVNLKYDIGWLRRLGCTIPRSLRIWDCQLAEFVLSGQTQSFASMDELCGRYGITGKEGGLESYWDGGIETADIPRDVVEAYNIGDTRRSIQIYQSQLADSRMTPALHKLILLQGADLLVLQKMESNGILYDAEASVKAGDEVLQQINEIKAELNEFVDWPHFNFDSGDHLSCLLYGGVVEVDLFSPTTQVYKSGPRKGETYTQNKFQETARREFPGLFKPLKGTELKKRGYYQTGEPILRQLPLRSKQQRVVVEALLRLGDLSKQVGGFLHALPKLAIEQGWERNVGLMTLHPTYNQTVARTGRLSCSKPKARLGF